MKFHVSGMDDGDSELSLGSTEADNGCYARDKGSSVDTECAGSVETEQKGKRRHRKKQRPEESVKNHLDDIKEEACSGTEEEQKMNAGKGKFRTEFTEEKVLKSSSKGVRKRSKKVLFGKGVLVMTFDPNPPLISPYLHARFLSVITIFSRWMLVLLPM